MHDSVSILFQSHFHFRSFFFFIHSSDWSCKSNYCFTISFSGLKIVRTPETKSQKVVPVYPLENLDTLNVATQSNNVVKVQPNNFLIDNKFKTVPNSNGSSTLDLNKSNYSPKNNLTNPNNHITNNEILTCEDVTYVARNDTLIHRAITTKVSKSDPEKAESETNVDVTSSKNLPTDQSRASTFHQILMNPAGARNILLDNTDNRAAIVLTKTIKIKENVVQLDTTNTETSSENMLR